MYKILHFSPVRKPPEIVNLHLRSLIDLDRDEVELTFSFFDDNDSLESTALIEEFCRKNSNSTLHNFSTSTLPDYQGDKRWQENLYERITFIKNAVITYFLDNKYDYLFLTDADLILHPKTLINLINQKKDFCASIFWTHFDKSPTYTPNCWYSVPQGFTPKNLLDWKESGTFEVDFTGACTLLSRRILSEGVSFKKIKNVSYLGEDKHFCIRASVLNYQAYINTENPSFHVYNANLVDLGKDFIKDDYQTYVAKWLNKDWENLIRKRYTSGKRKSIKEMIFSKLIIK